MAKNKNVSSDPGIINGQKVIVPNEDTLIWTFRYSRDNQTAGSFSLGNLLKWLNLRPSEQPIGTATGTH